MPTRKWLETVAPYKRELLAWVEETLENTYTKAELITLVLEFIENDSDEFNKWQGYKENEGRPIWRAKKELKRISQLLEDFNPGGPEPQEEYVELPKEVQVILAKLPETGMGYQTIVNGQWLLT